MAEMMDSISVNGKNYTFTLSSATDLSINSLTVTGNISANTINTNTANLSVITSSESLILKPTNNLVINSGNSSLSFNFQDKYWNISLPTVIGGQASNTYGLNVKCDTLSCTLQTGSFYLDNQNEMIAQFNFAYISSDSTTHYAIGRLYNEKTSDFLPQLPLTIDYYLPVPSVRLSSRVYLGRRVYTHNIYISGTLMSGGVVKDSGIVTCQFNSSISTEIKDLQTFAEMLDGVGTTATNIIPASGLLKGSLSSQTILGIYQHNATTPTTIGVTTGVYISAGSLTQNYYFSSSDKITIRDLVQSF